MSNTYTYGTIGFGGFGNDCSYNYQIEIVRENFENNGIVKVKGTVNQQVAPYTSRNAEVCVRLDVNVTTDSDGEPNIVTTYSVDGVPSTYATLRRAIEVASDECLSDLNNLAMVVLYSEIEDKAV